MMVAIGPKLDSNWEWQRCQAIIVGASGRGNARAVQLQFIALTACVRCFAAPVKAPPIRPSLSTLCIACYSRTSLLLVPADVTKARRCSGRSGSGRAARARARPPRAETPLRTHREEVGSSSALARIGPGRRRGFIADGVDAGLFSLGLLH